MNLAFGFRQGLVKAVLAGLVSVALVLPVAGQEAQAATQKSPAKIVTSSHERASQEIQLSKFQTEKKKKKRRKAAIANPDLLPQPQIAVVPGSVINLLSRSSKIPIAIKNDYASPVRVRVVVQPSNLKVLIPGDIEVQVPANTTVTAQVPVTAIGDGDVVLRTTLETFSGLRLTAPVDIQMKVILGVEDAVLFGFIGFVALLGGFGAFRTIRKNRRNLATNDVSRSTESKLS